MSKLLVAVLGRGIQMRDPHADPTKVESYVPTGDTEICRRDPETNRLSHLRVRVPADDDHPDSIIGGGELNLLAGETLIENAMPECVVCAYGARSDYLKPDGPSESEVMSRRLSERTFHYRPVVETWERNRELLGPSNTAQEFINILDLAVERNCEKVIIVTVGVHVPRAAVFLNEAIAMGGVKYNKLSPPVLLRSEAYLLEANSYKWGPRVEALWKSKSFARNWERETRGMGDWIRNQY